MKILKSTDWENTPINLDIEVPEGKHKGKLVKEGKVDKDGYILI